MGDSSEAQVEGQRWSREALRSMTPAERIAIAERLTMEQTAREVEQILVDHPDFTELEIRHELARRRYGSELADGAYGEKLANERRRRS